MGESMMAPAGPEQPPADSFFSRALGVFISPGQAFEGIVRRPDFLAPLIICTVGSVALIEVMLEKIGAVQIVRRALETSGRASQMTPEQLEQAMHRGATLTAIIMRVLGLVGVPLFLVIIAAMGLFIVNVIFGESIDFKAAFAVACYANLVLMVGVVLGIVVILFGDVERFNPENPIPSTVGFFLNQQETSRWVYVLASSFDVFRVWFILLTSLGLSVASRRKVGTLGIFLTFFGMWVLWVLAHTGWAALMG